jgi:DNA primase
MRFSPAFIDRLRSHFLISEVIGRRIAIKKHGREFQALCPFHNEKTPSFTINDEKGFFHCFGCAAHGDAIEFIKRYERLTYPETVERLAREAGIALPAPTPEERRKNESEKTLHDVCEAACAWFEKQLLAPAGSVARDYVEKRGLKPETLRQFRMGFAPDERTALFSHLQQLGFSQALQAEAGLIIVADTGAAYDRFRGRVMFPIRNVSGKAVAFGGRLLANSSGNKNLPKYLNSPETPLFKKGEMLFNLDLAKRPARDGNMVVVLEGYMDVVAVAQAGVPYAVATLGTAVTAEHLRLLWQLAKEPVICLDGDAAGARAMTRAAEVVLPLLKPGNSLRFATLPQGEDPDSYVQKHGKASFEQIVQRARRLSEIQWETLASQFRLNLPEGRAALDDACNKLCQKITDATVKNHYLSYFRKQLWSQPVAGKQAGGKKTFSGGNGKSRSAHVEHMVVQHHSAALDMLVRRMLHTLMQFPQLLHKSQVEETVSRLDIRASGLDALRNCALSAIEADVLDNHEAFSAYIQSQLPGDMLGAFGSDAIALPYRNTLSLEDAALLWNETANAYEVAHLEFELKELQENMAQTMDDHAYSRLVELKQAIEKARTARTFAPAETDVA